ncbi:hypothetical protein Nepgr_013279 [Nepenthes gracilis]|uniref:Uncharacterized protein n=1 Tax=Nepenthes gracilis TaxID=150966 RepID=A0AAD3SHH6_NEPGR|nr:hypothetical protein Nepgr_013279 [Nepenthes gracilis]
MVDWNTTGGSIPICNYINIVWSLDRSALSCKARGLVGEVRMVEQPPLRCRLLVLGNGRPLPEGKIYLACLDSLFILPHCDLVGRRIVNKSEGKIIKYVGWTGGSCGGSDQCIELSLSVNWVYTYLCLDCVCLLCRVMR